MTPHPPPARRGIHVATIPQEMRDMPRWICWSYVWKEGAGGRPGKYTKEPRIARGDGQHRASTTDADNWCSFNDAIACWRDHKLSGIGFVLTDSPFVGIDLDHKIDGDGNIDPLAVRIIKSLDSYTEITPSRAGFHIITSGELAGRGHNDQKLGVEVYGTGRYFTVTGDCVTTEQIETRRI